jgi:hypothetical protein
VEWLKKANDVSPHGIGAKDFCNARPVAYCGCAALIGLRPYLYSLNFPLVFLIFDIFYDRLQTYFV